jgi:hypothetical protein
MAAELPCHRNHHDSTSFTIGQTFLQSINHALFARHTLGSVSEKSDMQTAALCGETGHSRVIGDKETAMVEKEAYHVHETVEGIRLALGISTSDSLRTSAFTPRLSTTSLPLKGQKG